MWHVEIYFSCVKMFLIIIQDNLPNYEIIRLFGFIPVKICWVSLK